jgi:hypothetical protein
MDKFPKGFEAYLDLPSPEHRGHIRRFTRISLTDEQDVCIRYFRRLEAMELACDGGKEPSDLPSFSVRTPWSLRCRRKEPPPP